MQGPFATPCGRLDSQVEPLGGGPPALPLVRAGTLRALGVPSLQRLSSAPDIPTIAEQGVPGFGATQPYGLIAPAGMPRPIVERLNSELARIPRGEKLRPRLAAEGAEAAPGTPEQFGQFIAAGRALGRSRPPRGHAAGPTPAMPTAPDNEQHRRRRR
jgi:tripartite-type tricarboxylate transporter receptor subunit TctC